uniref:Small ribosomal subunit protein mS26 n=1 Tax=Strix occidentalis caurina TaxID=311401 RepID=A0A8D0KWC9_STROC
MLRVLRRCRPGPALGPALGPAAPPGPGSGAGPTWGPGLVLVRGRKTRHDPPAKSKASRVKMPPPVDPEELLVVLERYRQHRLVLGALRAEFRAEMLQKKREALLSQEDSAELMEQHRRLMAWNEAENARQRARRSAGGAAGQPEGLLPFTALAFAWAELNSTPGSVRDRLNSYKDA